MAEADAPLEEIPTDAIYGDDHVDTRLAARSKLSIGDKEQTLTDEQERWYGFLEMLTELIPLFSAFQMVQWGATGLAVGGARLLAITAGLSVIGFFAADYALRPVKWAYLEACWRRNGKPRIRKADCDWYADD